MDFRKLLLCGSIPFTEQGKIKLAGWGTMLSADGSKEGCIFGVIGPNLTARCTAEEGSALCLSLIRHWKGISISGLHVWEPVDCTSSEGVWPCAGSCSGVRSAFCRSRCSRDGTDCGNSLYTNKPADRWYSKPHLT